MNSSLPIHEQGTAAQRTLYIETSEQGTVRRRTLYTETIEQGKQGTARQRPLFIDGRSLPQP